MAMFLKVNLRDHLQPQCYRFSIETGRKLGKRTQFEAKEETGKLYKDSRRVVCPVEWRLQHLVLIMLGAKWHEPVS